MVNKVIITFIFLALMFKCSDKSIIIDSYTVLGREVKIK